MIDDIIINDKTSNPVQEPIAFPPNLDLDLEATPIFISLLPNGTVDNGKGSFSLVLRRGGFVLEGDMSGSNPVNLLLRIPVPNGNYKHQNIIFGLYKSPFVPFTDAAFLFFWSCTDKCKNIEFAFDLENDTSLLVATEMVQELELPSWSMPIVAKLVDAFLLKTVRGWRPCVQVGQMIQAVQNTASVNGKSI
jgi:WNK lysine deficient protein kinase